MTNRRIFENCKSKMKSRYILGISSLLSFGTAFLLLLMPWNAEAAGLEKPDKFPAVTIKDTELRLLKSRFTGVNYELEIFLPAGYRSNDAVYPAVYILDAESNFPCAAYIARRLIKNGDIPKVMLVGIAYEANDEKFYYETRMRDFSPVSRIHGHHTGGIEKFVDFLRVELFPFVEGNYRVKKNDRLVVGHSISGFFCAYMLFNHPEYFHSYLVVSPSFWFSDRIIMQYEKEYAGKNRNLEADVFLMTGEDESSQMVDSTRQFINAVRNRNYQKLKFEALIQPGEHHRSVYPLAFTRGLQFFFNYRKKDDGS